MQKSETDAIIPVILCGGSGTRLWPLSRKLYPKPFVKMADGRTLFSRTLERVRQIPNIGMPLLITNEDYRFYILEILERLGFDADIILEPAARNTAPAIALAAFSIAEKGDALMLVAPADHLFDDESTFCDTVVKAAMSAQDGSIVTFGVIPSRPEHGYGYIRKGEAKQDDCFIVQSFVEKPDQETARQMIATGDYFWNSGIFLMSASVYLEELKNYAPKIYSVCEQAWRNKTLDKKFLRPHEETFLRSPEDSIDFAVMEKTSRAVMYPLYCGWSDMGSWDSFFQAGQRDGAGNVSIGDVILEDVENSYVHAHKRLVAAVGVKDIAIVDSGDAVLVLPRDRAQEVKKIVSHLKKQGREEFKLHPVVYRPWGSYERLVSGSRFQVKRIIVKPGCSLSLQMHHHRSEHWIIVRGTAEITIGETTTLYTENQSAYIPLGQLHRLYNPGKIPLELIEVQSGSYLGEDDILRFEDKYGRK